MMMMMMGVRVGGGGGRNGGWVERRGMRGRRATVSYTHFSGFFESERSTDMAPPEGNFWKKKAYCMHRKR